MFEDAVDRAMAEGNPERRWTLEAAQRVADTLGVDYADPVGEFSANIMTAVARWRWRMQQEESQVTIHMTATEARVPGEWRAFCRCPWTSETFPTQEAARAACDQHLKEANR